MTYLVTGGAGFIGSQIARALLAAGHTVRILDNFSTGKRERVPDGAEVFEYDITNLESIRPAFQGVEGVFHTAALARVPLSIEKPLETHNVNVNGTLHVLLAARDAGVKRVVYSASSSAYGEQGILPWQEDMCPAPVHPYGLQKYVGEHYMRIFSRCYGIETVSLRYFNVYGPHLAFSGAYVSVLAIFLRQQRAGESLSIVGDGSQTRDFTYVDDVVRANMLAMESDRVGTGEVINVGAGEPRSVNTIAALFPGERINLPARIEAMHSHADTTRAKELLGWEPTVPFNDGFERTRAWFNEQASL